MKIVIDTNVIISGIFFNGYPGEILKNTANGLYQLVLSEEILAEYKEVIIRILQKRKAPIGGSPFQILDLLVSQAIIIDARSTKTPPCEDPDDIKFLQAAIAAKAKFLISGPLCQCK